jgi:hypothetical protein
LEIKLRLRAEVAACDPEDMPCIGVLELEKTLYPEHCFFGQKEFNRWPTCPDNTNDCYDERFHRGFPTCASDSELLTEMCNPANLNRAGKTIDCWLEPGFDAYSGWTKTHTHTHTHTPQLKLYAEEPCGEFAVKLLIGMCTLGHARLYGPFRTADMPRTGMCVL